MGFCDCVQNDGRGEGSMTDTLDAYLKAALTSRRPDRQQRLNHIGVAVATDSGNHIVAAVLHASPAFAAGLLRGDRPISINGAPYHPVYSFNPEPPALPEPDQRSFRLVFERSGEQREVELRPEFNNLLDSYRSAVEPSVRQFGMGNKVVGYVRLWGVSRNANDLVMLQKVLAGFRNTSSLIVDLRHAAGYLAEEHLALFRPTDQSDYYSSPMALIIDRTTTRHAESFARQLAILDRVTTLGAATPGGFHPDLTVPWPLASSTPGDPQFEAALALLGGLI